MGTILFLGILSPLLGNYNSVVIQRSVMTLIGDCGACLSLFSVVRGLSACFLLGALLPSSLVFLLHPSCWVWFWNGALTQGKGVCFHEAGARNVGGLEYPQRVVGMWLREWVQESQAGSGWGQEGLAPGSAHWWMDSATGWGLSLRPHLAPFVGWRPCFDFFTLNPVRLVS